MRKRMFFVLSVISLANVLSIQTEESIDCKLLSIVLHWRQQFKPRRKFDKIRLICLDYQPEKSDTIFVSPNEVFPLSDAHFRYCFLYRNIYSMFPLLNSNHFQWIPLERLFFSICLRLFFAGLFIFYICLIYCKEIVFSSPPPTKWFLWNKFRGEGGWQIALETCSPSWHSHSLTHFRLLTYSLAYTHRATSLSTIILSLSCPFIHPGMGPCMWSVLLSTADNLSFHRIHSSVCDLISVDLITLFPFLLHNNSIEPDNGSLC